MGVAAKNKRKLGFGGEIITEEKDVKKLCMTLVAFLMATATMLVGGGCNASGTEESSSDGSVAVESSAAPTESLLAVDGQRRFFLGSSFSHDGLLVYKQTEGQDLVLLEEDTYTVDASAFDGDSVGSYTIEVCVTGEDLSTTYDVEVFSMRVQENRLKVLMIGNSFSDDTIEYAWHIANDLGVEEIVLGNLFIAGCDLNYHVTNMQRDAANYDFRVWQNGAWVNTPKTTMDEGIAYADWDFITLQQSSGQSGEEISYRHLEKLLNHVREKATNQEVQVLWNMTWAYQQNSSHEDFQRYDRDQTTMYQAIISCVNKQVAAVDIDGIVPCGTAIQNGRLSDYGDTWTRDGFHLSLTQGRYLAGVTLVGALTGRDLSTLEYMPSGVTVEQREVIKQCAIDALRCPLTPTKP